MFRCIFAMTWYEYCCPDTMLAEKRRRTTTCKKMFVRTIPHLARYGHLYEEKQCDHADCIMAELSAPCWQKHSRF